MSGRKLFNTRCIVTTVGIAILCVIVIVLMHGVVYTVRNVMPETEMILNSRCKNPYWGWDGKIMDVPVYKSSFADRPTYFNIHKETDYNASSAITYPPMDKDRPIIIWGTHHKTGTFIAKKIFAKICARMNWCCLFHVTRDSYHAMNHVLHTEKVDVLGHNMWLWNPAELNLTNYRFVHFYRHPFRKVVSGYRYHFDGAEFWTKKNLLFDKICDDPLVRSRNTKRAVVQQASLKSVIDYCGYTHLCETCCRTDHEVDQNKYSSNMLKYEYVPETRIHINDHSLTSVHKNHSTRSPVGKSGAASRRLQVGMGGALYRRRGDAEYDFMCRHLGGMNGSSLQSTLQAVSMERGILIEAALDYYESLRMAHIVNQTLFDPRTLNIDLDDMTADFNYAVWRILNHLRGMIPAHMMQSLHDELMFYDLNTSPLYAWSMSNPLVNHVDPHASSSSEQVKVLVDSPEVAELYREVFELMGPALAAKKKKSTPK